MTRLGAFDHIFYLEAELREPFEGPAGELGDLSLPSDNAGTRTPEREDARALEDRIVGVVRHDAGRAPAVPALQPILHEAEVQHDGPLPSRLRAFAAGAAFTSDIQWGATGSFRRPCGPLRACPDSGSSAPLHAGHPCYPRRAWHTLAILMAAMAQPREPVSETFEHALAEERLRNTRQLNLFRFQSLTIFFVLATGVARRRPLPRSAPLWRSLPFIGRRRPPPCWQAAAPRALRIFVG